MTSIDRWSCLIPALAVSLFCISCSTDQYVAERVELTQFDRTGQNLFTYVGHANAIQPLNSPGGEAARLNTLRVWLDENKMCPRGFVISDRYAVKVETLLGIDVFKVHYKGACK